MTFWVTIDACQPTVTPPAHFRVMGDDALAKALAENVRRSRAMTEGMQSGQYGAKPSAITDTSHLDDTDEDT